LILKTDPDAVALQELTGKKQLKVLLDLLQGRYRGEVAEYGSNDRFEAVLVKDAQPAFTLVEIGAGYAAAVVFRPAAGVRQIALLSAHADAFNAARRRRYTEGVMDWAQSQMQSSDVFIAGDFNFELTAANETNLYTDNVKHDSESYSYILRNFQDLGRKPAIPLSTIGASITFLAPLDCNALTVRKSCATPRLDVWTIGLSSWKSALTL
jgi:endonuclease/exonuclease/phosphatase family metal-dependent hydrolase